MVPILGSPKGFEAAQVHVADAEPQTAILPQGAFNRLEGRSLRCTAVGKVHLMREVCDTNVELTSHMSGSDRHHPLIAIGVVQCLLMLRSKVLHIRSK